MELIKNIKFVDLDLPSGTLWADRNLGAKKPGGNSKLYGWPCKRILELEDIDITGTSDFITRLAGPNYSLPTRDDFEELITNTTQITSDSHITLVSKKDKRKHISIPYDGWMDFSHNIQNSFGTYFCLWSSTAGLKRIYCMDCYLNAQPQINAFRREHSYGHSIRIVKKNEK